MNGFFEVFNFFRIERGKKSKIIQTFKVIRSTVKLFESSECVEIAVGHIIPDGFRIRKENGSQRIVRLDLDELIRSAEVFAVSKSMEIHCDDLCIALIVKRPYGNVVINRSINIGIPINA